MKLSDSNEKANTRETATGEVTIDGYRCAGGSGAVSVPMDGNYLEEGSGAISNNQIVQERTGRPDKE